MRRQWSEHAAQFWVISHYFYGASGKVLRRLGHVSGLLPTECMPWFGNTSRTFTKLNVAMILYHVTEWLNVCTMLRLHSKWTFFNFHSTWKIDLRNWMLSWFCTTLRNDWVYTMLSRVGRISLFMEISKRLVLYVCKIVTKKSCQNLKALDQYLHLPQAK